MQQVSGVSDRSKQRSYIKHRDTFDCDHVKVKGSFQSEVSVSNLWVHLSYQSMEWLNNYNQVYNSEPRRRIKQS